jgi:maltose O-acetyltransferase
MSGARTFAVRVTNFATNGIVAKVPSFTARHRWYRDVIGLSIGRGSRIHSGCYVWFYGPGQIRRSGTSIGEHCVINRGCCLDVRGTLVMGDNVSVSPEVAILTTQHDYRDPAFPLQSRPVVIEDHVWIGMRATILPGTTIGRGAVVAAGAVASGEIEPFTVVAGVPARPVAKRPHDAAGYVLDEPVPWFE